MYIRVYDISQNSA